MMEDGRKTKPRLDIVVVVEWQTVTPRHVTSSLQSTILPHLAIEITVPMLHFPSKLPSTNTNGIPRRFDSLNATQQKSTASHPIFLKVEEELHDARRVHADGQEDDLRSALSMVINRVTELSAMLSEAYRVQADLEVQLNVAKSNLQLVIANNEMLEDALKRDTSIPSKDVGWRRSSARESVDSNGAAKPRSSLDRSQSVDYSPVPSSQPDASPPLSAGTTASAPSSSQSQDNRFFKFRFSSSSSSSRPASRPETPTTSPHIPGQQPNAHSQAHPHLTSPSMPSLTTAGPSVDMKLKEKAIEELTSELEKERAAKKLIAQQKAALEEELESLSQALFEEANKMVADERKARAETEEELKELRMEKEALRSALRLIDGENAHLRETTSAGASPVPPAAAVPSGLDIGPGERGPSRPASRSHSRSSSQIGVKSRPESLDLSYYDNTYPPLPPSPAPDAPSDHDESWSQSHPHPHPHPQQPSHPDHPGVSASGTSTTPISIGIQPPTATATATASGAPGALSPGVTSPTSPEDSQPTPRWRVGSMGTGTGTPQDELFMGGSAWADVPSRA